VVHSPSNRALYLRAGCMVFVDRGQILAIERDFDPLDLGVPGGLVDDGEDCLDAAVREAYEEAGLTVFSCAPLCEWVSPDGGLVRTYVATEWAGSPRGSREGSLRWVRPSELPSGQFERESRRVVRCLRERGLV